ncbi:MAG TPA: hypothetical protein P5121_27845 [Caldilineaceae bacterium]|nr:hypothetical protein [Caldilineaceae bacterium]
MTIVNFAITLPIAEVLTAADRLTATERLFVARWLLDSVLTKESDDVVDWQELGRSAFEKEWDNEEDAIYDEWRRHYGVPTG